MERLHCKECRRMRLFIDGKCNSCIPDEIDDAVRLEPTRKARCGHLSFNYYACDACKQPEAQGEDLRGISKKVALWCPETLSYPAVTKPVGHAWRQKVDKLSTARGYYYDKTNNVYKVRFRGRFIGHRKTATEARELYSKAVQEAHNERKKSDLQVPQSQVLRQDEPKVR